MVSTGLVLLLLSLFSCYEEVTLPILSQVLFHCCHICVPPFPFVLLNFPPHYFAQSHIVLLLLHTSALVLPHYKGQPLLLCQSQGFSHIQFFH